MLPKPPNGELPKDVEDAVIWPKGDAVPLPLLKTDVVVDDENPNGDCVEDGLANEDSVLPVPACKNGDDWEANVDMPELLKADAVVVLLLFTGTLSSWAPAGLSAVGSSLLLFSAADLVTSPSFSEVCEEIV